MAENLIIWPLYLRKINKIVCNNEKATRNYRSSFNDMIMFQSKQAMMIIPGHFKSPTEKRTEHHFEL